MRPEGDTTGATLPTPKPEGSTTTTEDGSTSAPPAESSGEEETGFAFEECDPFASACPADHKCAPWATNGTASSARCVPLPSVPVLPGGNCEVDLLVDDCAAGSACDEEHTCVPFCLDASHCGAGQHCSRGPIDFGLCIDLCDPLGDTCPSDEACYFVGDGFVCAGDASGEGGAYGDPCEFANACAAGLLCSPACACCVAPCDTQAASCPGGTACTDIFGPGEAPHPLLEDVGLCERP